MHPEVVPKPVPATVLEEKFEPDRKESEKEKREKIKMSKFYEREVSGATGPPYPPLPVAFDTLPNRFRNAGVYTLT